MSNEATAIESDIVTKLSRVLPLMKALLWSASAIGAAVLAVAGWVWTQQEATNRNTIAIDQLKPRVEQLEVIAIRSDAAPPASQVQLFELDKRIDHLNQQMLTIREQNAMILDLIKKAH